MGCFFYLGHNGNEFSVQILLIYHVKASFLQIYCIALLLAVCVFKIYDMPVYTDKDNLAGICLLLFMFGFATIPMVHLCEKLFTDASLANMHILCMNVIVSLATRTIIILFDILGDSDVSIQANFLYVSKRTSFRKSTNFSVTYKKCRLSV